MKGITLQGRLARWAAPALLVAGSVLSFGLAWLVQTSQETRAQQNLSSLAEQLSREIGNDIAAYGTTLRGLHGLFINSPRVDRRSFRQYVEHLRLQHDAALLHAFLFIERVTPAERPAFEETLRRDPVFGPDGRPDFKLKPDGDQPTGFVVSYIEPLPGNALLLGQDVNRLPAARDALERLMAGGGLTLSAPFSMERTAAGATGMALFLPLYATGNPAGPYAATGSKTAALVGIAINVERTLRDIAVPLAQRHVHVRITELERAWAADGAAANQPIFDSGPGTASAVPSWLTASRELEVLGNRWRLDITADPETMPPGTRYAPEIALALSLSLTLLLFLLVRNLGRIGTLATAQAERMTKELRQSEEVFRDLAELSSDWFWEQDEQFRFTRMSGGVEHKGNFSVEATLGRTRWELPILGVSEEEWVRHRALLERHEPFHNFAYRIEPGDGRVHWYSVSGKPVFAADGHFIGYRGTAHDITRAKQAEQHLRESQERLALAVEATAVGIWDYDPVSRSTYFSPRFTELLGFSDEREMRANFFLRDALHPDDRERVLAAQAGALNDESRFDEIYRLRRRDGSYRWFRGLGLSHLDAGGKVIRFTGAITDITAQKESDEALRDSEAQLRKAQAIARLGSWYLDIPGDRLTWSAETYRIFGIAAGTPLTYELFIDRVHPDDREKVDRAWNEAMQGRPYDLEHRLVADGQERWVRELAEIVFDAAGNAVSGTGIVQDISERKQAETQLHLAATVFENSLEGVTITDTGRNIVSVNRAFTDITGYRREEVLGRNPRLLQSGRHDGAFYRAMWDSIREKGYWRGEIWNKRKNGEVYPQLLGISAVLDPRGQPTHYIGVFSDISELKRAEEAMRQFNAELERRVAERTAALSASNKELEAFSYSVSHDLRAPLRAIDGYAHILAEDYADRLDDAARRQLDRIRLASQRMSLITDQMMELARITRIELHPEEVDLSALVRVIGGELPDDAGRRFELVVAPGVRASADPGLLHVVLQNLIHNAWKFTGRTENARIEFGVARVGGERAFFVRDNGAGFDPAYAGKLFGAFQRLHRPDEFAGTGIGLATVQRIVQRHGGRVWAEGAVGEGATFYFTLG